MVSVREALRLSEFSNVVVRTGKGGLFRKISWTHVIDHDDVGHFLEGGELLLTCGQVWPQDKVLEDKLLKGFLRHQVAGILFATGHYLKECPPAALEFGEKYDIPVLEVPFEVQFVKITKIINQEILTRQLRKKEVTSNLPLEFREKLKTATSRTEIYNILSTYLKCPIVITDPMNKVLDIVIPKGEKRINIRQTMDKLTHIFASELLYTNGHDMETELRAIYVATKTPPYAIAVPLQIEGNYWGTLWLLNFHQRLEEMHELALEHTATVLLDSHLNYQEVEVTYKQLRLELIELLFEKPKTASLVIKDRINKLGLYPNKNWMVGFALSGIRGQSFNLSIEMDDLSNECKKWIDRTDGIDGLCEVYEGQLIFLISYTLEFAELKNKLKNLYIHLGNIYKQIAPVFVFGGKKPELLSVVESYQEAKSLAPIVQFLNNEGGIYFADQLRRELIIYGGMGPDKAQELRNLILPEELLSERGIIFYETLKCLVSLDYNREKVAKALHIHRNTLRYRIERIESFLQDSISSPRCQYWINVAFDLESLTKQNHITSMKKENDEYKEELGSPTIFSLY
jgi:PucR family transcriptional regulator, purine catabolism regulatory protein